jgi:hypothetical protein
MQQPTQQQRLRAVRVHGGELPTVLGEKIAEVKCSEGRILKIILQPAFGNSRNAGVFNRNDNRCLCSAGSFEGANPTGVSLEVDGYFKADFNTTKGRGRGLVFAADQKP